MNGLKLVVLIQKTGVKKIHINIFYKMTMYSHHCVKAQAGIYTGV